MKIQSERTYDILHISETDFVKLKDLIYKLYDTKQITPDSSLYRLFSAMCAELRKTGIIKDGE
jgi:hypothetical protein